VASESHIVFISYASEDQAWADRLGAWLEARGIRCWIASRDVPPGANYAASIVTAIADACAMVVVISSKSVESLHVAREVERASDKQVAILPFRVEDVALPDSLGYFLATVQRLDAFAIPPDAIANELVRAVTGLMSRRAPKPRSVRSIQTAGATVQSLDSANLGPLGAGYRGRRSWRDLRDSG
jgi:hypothetical protein